MSDYSQRTKLNIQDSDGTLILKLPPEVTINDGTVLTEEEAKEKKNPYLIIDLSQSFNEKIFPDWIEKNQIKTLNVAGPRESQSEGIYNNSKIFSLKI